MRLGGISGIAHQSEHLSAFNLVAHLHSKRARLKVRVHGEHASAEIEINVITCDRIQRDRRDWCLIRNIFWNAALHFDDYTVADRSS